MQEKTKTQTNAGISRRAGSVCGKLLPIFTALILMIASIGIIANYYTIGYDVYYSGENVGTVSSKKAAQNACDKAVMLDGNATSRKMKLVMRIAPISDVRSSDVLSGILGASKRKADCAALVADGMTLAYLETEADAANAVETFATRFKSADVSVSKNYEIVPVEAAQSDISTIDEAVAILGESGAIKVSYTRAVTNEYAVECEEVVLEDPDLPLGTEKVVQKGENGRTSLTYTMYYENGNLLKAVPTSKVVITAPKERIVHIGTRVSGLPSAIDCPVNGTYTSGYGERWGRAHTGVDIGAPTGTPVYAPFTGTVIFAGERGGYGNYVKVDHGDGDVTAYAHLDSIAVSSGQKLNKGDLIGMVGTTGNVTGPHLHFEIIKNGEYIDPVPFIKS